MITRAIQIKEIVAVLNYTPCKFKVRDKVRQRVYTILDAADYSSFYERLLWADPETVNSIHEQLRDYICYMNWHIKRHVTVYFREAA